MNKVDYNNSKTLKVAEITHKRIFSDAMKCESVDQYINRIINESIEYRKIQKTL